MHLSSYTNLSQNTVPHCCRVISPIGKAIVLEYVLLRVYKCQVVWGGEVDGEGIEVLIHRSFLYWKNQFFRIIVFNDILIIVISEGKRS